MPTPLGSPLSETGEENVHDIQQTSPGISSGSPLEKTIDRIGMGSYQRALLGLCGLGWAADNMWLQAVAIALPRVQVHYSVSSSSIGYLSATTFLGMMIGALLWGTLSDLLGRIRVFQLTLFFAAAFGFLAFYVDTFPSLCFANFLLGTAVGGSMPTDGTFALEILPRNKRHLLTSLSIFFSFGSVAAAFVALVVIPGNSCQAPSHDSTTGPQCDAHKDNNGWKYMYLVLAFITVAMFLSRILFFRLHESPRFLVHTGREEEAAIALTDIAKFNGDRLRVTVADVKDDNEDDFGEVFESEEEREGLLMPSPVRTAHIRMDSSAPLQRPTKPSRSANFLRKWLGTPLQGWYSRITGLLRGEWKTRTLLIWGIWMSMAFAYTMFNVFLPTFLEYRSETESVNQLSDDAPPASSSLTGPLWEVVIFTLGGCPGSLVGAYLIDAAPRYRMSKSTILALATFVTSAFCFAFVMVSGYYVVMITTIGISLSSTAMWSILYGMTPELFVTEVRGTACGTASALSRVGGIMAPLIGGILVSINPSLIVITSVVIFLVAVVLVLWLDRVLKHSSSISPSGSPSQTP